MTWLTYTALIKKSGLHDNTVKRRLRTLKEKEPDLDEILVNRKGKTPRYKDPECLEYVKLSKTVVRKKKTMKKKPTKKQAKEKPRNISKKAIKSIQQLFETPVVYTMDEFTTALYQGLKSEAHRIIFEAAIRILEDYVFTTMSLDACCKIHGGSRHMFRRWCNKVAPIDQIYERAKVSRGREDLDRRNEYYSMNLDHLSGDRIIELESKHCEIDLNIHGKELYLPMFKTTSQKHVTGSASTTTFYLSTKMSSEYQRPYPSTGETMLVSEKFMDPLQEQLSNMSASELQAFLEESEEMVEHQKGAQ